MSRCGVGGRYIRGGSCCIGLAGSGGSASGPLNLRGSSKWAAISAGLRGGDAGSGGEASAPLNLRGAGVSREKVLLLFGLYI